MQVVANAAALIPLALMALICVADTHRAPLETTPVFFGLLALWAAGLALVAPRLSGKNEAAGAGVLWFARGAEAHWLRVAAAVAGLLLAHLATGAVHQKMVLFRMEQPVWIAFGAVWAVLAVVVVRPPRPALSLALIVAVGIVARTAGLWQWEIDPARRDMLALVLSALDRFTSGENPYGLHQMQVGSQVPLTYPPGLWLAHLPAYLLGADVRFIGVLADGIAAIALGGVALYSRAPLRGPVLVGVAAYLFLPDVHWNGIYAEPNLDWAIVACFGAAVAARRPLLAGALLGAALAVRPFNLVLAPFAAIWLARGFGARTLFRALLITGLVAAAIFTPFVLRDPDAFYAGTVRWLLEYGPAHSKWFYGMMGLSGPLYKEGLAAWLLPLQLGSVAVVIALAAWRQRTSAGALSLAAVAYALFVAFNSIIWMSFWIGVCALALAATAATGAAPRVAEAPSRIAALAAARPRIVAAAEILGWVCVAAALFAMLLPLRAHFADGGRRSTESYLRAELRPGDLVLDRSGYRVAFLFAKPILAGRDLRARARLASDPYTLLLPRRAAIPNPLEPSRIYAVERYGLLDEHRALYLGSDGDGPYTEESNDRRGRFRIAVFGARHDGARAAIPELKPARFLKVPRAMLEARPSGKGERVIDLPVIGEPRWVTVYGGLVDGAPQWRRADVEVVVRCGTRQIGRHVFPNAPGLRGASFRLPDERCRSVTLGVSAASPKRRNFHLDALWVD